MTAQSAAFLGRRVGNGLYEAAFPIYRPLYRLFKTMADRRERKLLRSQLPQGSVVVDAGANIGIYSQFLAACVGPTGLVHCFEPSPDNFRRLSETLSAAPNVCLNQAALGEKSGDSILYLSDDLNVDHRSYLPAGETRRTVPISLRSLDDYFPPAGRVDLIKMDIQGFELHALQGATRVLEENPKIKLLLEFWPYGLEQAGTDWHDLIAFLERRDMSILQMERATPRPFDSRQVKTGRDWFINLFIAPMG